MGEYVEGKSWNLQELDYLSGDFIVQAGAMLYPDERTVEILDEVSAGPHPSMRVWVKKTISHAEAKRRGLLWQGTIDKAATHDQMRAYFRRLWLAGAPLATFALEQKRLGIDDPTLYSFEIDREDAAEVIEDLIAAGISPAEFDEVHA